ncbi:hypothetical protein M569_06242, partial [Genlisea aurea]
GTLVFEINKQRFQVPEIDPSTTLLEFLRTRTPFKSAKLSCGEGSGCGACVVLLTKYDALKKQVQSFSISSCLTLLCSVNGCSVTTSEGLGNRKDGFHPVHQRFAGFHASQCGFCTPGMCISFFSALANAEKKNRGNPLTPGFSNLSSSEAEKAITGNLCRCTGYRPIADACKSFAADVDLEDLGMNSFWKKGDTKEARIGKLTPYDPKLHVSPHIKLSDDLLQPVRILNSEKHSWYTPLTIEELQNMLNFDKHENGESTKLVVGNTGDGYYKETKKYNKYIDLRYISELSAVRKDNSGIEFGAALTISTLISYMKEIDSGKGGDTILAKIANHMEKVASGFIRNSGSLGGNIVMAQRKHFPSDIATLLISVFSSVSLMDGNQRKIISMEDFLCGSPMDHKTVLLSIHIPFSKNIQANGSIQTERRSVIETYRASPRPLGNALPYVNASFLADISPRSNGIFVIRANLAFGAYGTKHPVRARKTEEFIVGRILSVDVIYGAIQLVKVDVVPDEGTPYASYRSSLAVGFLFDFLIKLYDKACGSSGILINGHNMGVNSPIKPVGNSLLSSSQHVLESSKDYYPVGEPMVKSGAAIQASGEAVYVDDIPSPPNCLEGAIVYSTKPLARVKSIYFNGNPQPVAVFSVNDIPREGANIGCISLFGAEPLFADGISGFAGDRVALVVAESRRNAYLAAKNAVVDYDTEGLESPILSVEEAVKRSSFFDVPVFALPKNIGDFSNGMAEAEHRILSAEVKLGSQYYFYMETQAALAIPDEDHCITVYSSNQCAESAQRTISKCIGVPEHNVTVITRRVGGGFGGKALKAIPIATMCAVAAHKLRRPVRMYLDRKTDMIIAGGRHPMKVNYTVGFRSDGKITALHADILIDAGVTEDVSLIIPFNLIGAFKKYNWEALSFDIKLCKTNSVSRSAMRAPGEVQGTYIAEAIIEHVASVLSMDVDSIRGMNLHTHSSLTRFYGGITGEPSEYTLLSIWDKVAKLAEFEKRKAAVEEFNKSSIWYKRGVSRVPIVFQVTQRATPAKVSILSDGSIVVEVGGIELGQGLYTKARQVAAYGLSLVQCDVVLEDLVEKIRVIQADTLSLTQGGFTAGSTTSESSCEAVRLCCNVLVERLLPLKTKVQEQMGGRGGLSWEVLIRQAYYKSIHLSANSMFLPNDDSKEYLNYGAAVSEVEVSILTGETTILRTDIVYDCGQSMNPAVDMGQIEGGFVQGVGFFMVEEYETDADGLTVQDGTWNYKIPTMDTIPKQFNVEILNSGHHKKRILSSKASGEPPLLLAASVHCATRAAIAEARKQLASWGGAVESEDVTRFQLDVPATMPAVKKLCGLDVVEVFLQQKCAHNHQSQYT